MADANLGQRFKQAAMKRVSDGITVAAWGEGSGRSPPPLTPVVLV